MKAFLAIISVFIVVIALVYQSGYYSHDESKTVINPTPVKEKSKPARVVEPEKVVPEQIKIVYVPQVIEKVYVREIYHTERVVYHAPVQRDYRPASYSRADNCCSSFTGSARTKCYRYMDAGYTCQQFQSTITYVYCPNTYRR